MSGHRVLLTGLLATSLASWGAVAGCTRQAATASIILTNADVITEGVPGSAAAVAIAGSKILAVGSAAGLARYRGPSTEVIDLAGRTVVPGFIDAHQYRVQKYVQVGYPDPAFSIQVAFQQGWTTLDELYADPGVLDTLTQLDRDGKLPIHINAYLPVMQYDETGTSLGDWYQAYHQGQQLSSHVRVAGLIAFTDFDNARVLLWTQDKLNAFLLGAQRQGWVVALKTVSTRSLEMILSGYEYVASIDPTVVNRHNRLEHTLFVTAGQDSRIKRLGLIPVINLNNPGQLVGQADIDQFITREPVGSFAPWRRLEQAGLTVADGSGWPSYYVDEPSGAPFGSPIHLIYQAVTRVGNLGTQPYPWLLNQSITAEQALQALTINSAQASGEQDVAGSITAGKRADLVVLSANPVQAAVNGINSIEVLATVIDGQARWCAEDGPNLCPGGAPSPDTTASSADPWIGTWSAPDPTDGSALTLHVSRTDAGYQVLLLDDRASTCGVDGAGRPRYAASVAATGILGGTVLTTVVTSVTCLSDPPTTKQLTLTIRYTYDAGTGTLRDDAQSATWHRI